MVRLRMKPRQLNRVLRSALLTLIVCSFFVAASTPALAVFSENDIGCAGSAVITDPDGKTYNIDAEDTRVTIPREGSASWEGSTAGPVHNHSGEIFLDFDLFDVGIDSWGSPNDGDDTEAAGVANMPQELKWAPPGIYTVAGSHSGDEGSCSGRVEIVLGEGGDVWKYALLALTALFFGGFVWSGFAKG